MKCKNCGKENLPQNRYCTNCGTELKALNKAFNFCPECGAKNKSKNNFCENCGAQLGVKSNKSQKKRKRVNNVRSANVNKELKLAGFIERNKALSGVIAIGLGIIVFLLFNNDVHRNRANTNFSGNNIAAGFAGGKFVEIASKFTCACGECNDDLTDCSCPTANREKQLIQDELEENTPEIVIIKKVNKEYGMLKTKYAYLLNRKTMGSKTAEEETNRNAIATVADRDVIISKFECLCGECNVPELAECNCTHPNGAQEVKGFIDRQISAKKYSVREIIEMVNNKFHSLKT